MDPVAATTAGRVRGTAEDDTVAFLGIPYARAPFGIRRFGLPVPEPAWNGVRDAIDYGPTAPQPDRPFTIIPEPVLPGDECLNLNVFTPDLGSVRLPVLVWIHGGGFTAGGNTSPWYRGHRFARDGVVVVSVNYRLGAEGFLSIPGAPVNRAVHDWIAALELGAGQRRRVRRRPRPGHDRRAVGRRRRVRHAAHRARGAVACSTGRSA